MSALLQQNANIMKVLFTLLFACCSLLPLAAQQQQEELRAHSQLLFPEFRNAKVLQTFNRRVKAKANILYKNAALCYLDEKDNKVYQAVNKSIVGVEFDSIRYMKVNDIAMGRVIAQQGQNLLLCVTTIDMQRYKAQTGGGSDLPFFEIDMAGFGLNQLMDLSGAEQLDNHGYPLKQEYYFMLKGRVVEARERSIKKEVLPEMKEAFKNLMNDRWWSWKDPASLSKLFIYFPQ